jgi:hypothetical protein
MCGLRFAAAAAAANLVQAGICWCACCAAVLCCCALGCIKHSKLCCVLSYVRRYAKAVVTTVLMHQSTNATGTFLGIINACVLA